MEIIEQHKLTNFNEIIYQELVKSDFADKSIEDDKSKFSANTLFQIEAISNLNEPFKTKYQNSKSGMLQLMLYPGKMIGVEMEKLNNFDKDLLQYAGQKVHLIMLYLKLLVK